MNARGTHQVKTVVPGLSPGGATSMREMPEAERPRERLDRLGAEALRDAELIAVMLRTGTRQENAVALADRLLRRFGDLRALSRASLQELQQVKGIGRVKAIELKAGLELGKRLAAHTRPRPESIRCAGDVVRLLMHQFKEYETEHLKAVLLDTKRRLMKVVEISQGGLDGTEAAPRDVLRQAVREGAAALVLVHNHPSGDPQPSQADVLLTRRIAEAGQLVGIPLEDHVILGDGQYVSMKERQYL